ncbi:site-specific integrase [Acrocarpospora sp. B8E8]|uniref:tyrosine-type recombinase/integrase n=1 Tax=Acrocarpospora sp. B8E8 TaxID=3153572 RepID=UPI00325C57CE
MARPAPHRLNTPPTHGPRGTRREGHCHSTRHKGAHQLLASIKRIQLDTLKNGKPQYSYRVMWRDPDGKQKAKNFRLKKDAEAFRAEIEAAKNKGLYFDPHAGKILFRDYAEKWLAAKRATKALGTVTAYTERLEGHILPTFGSSPLASISRSDVQDWVNGLTEYKGLAPRTVQVIYRQAAAIFGRAVADDRIGRTPCRGIELPVAIKKEVEPLEPEQVLAIAEVIPALWEAMVITAAGTGMRWSELAGLTVDRVDFLRRTAKVDRQLSRSRAKGLFAPPKSKASNRVIPLPDLVIAALAEHIAEYGTGPEGLIFTSERGHALNYKNFRARVWVKTLAAMEPSEEATFHTLRHTYASLLIQAGESPKVIQERLGHASITETMDTYGHLYPDSDQTTRAAIDAAFALTDVDASPDVDETLIPGPDADTKKTA